MWTFIASGELTECISACIFIDINQFSVVSQALKSDFHNIWDKMISYILIAIHIHNNSISEHLNTLLIETTYNLNFYGLQYIFCFILIFSCHIMENIGKNDVAWQ